MPPTIVIVENAVLHVLRPRASEADLPRVRCAKDEGKLMARRKGNRPALASLLDQYGNTCRSLKLKPTYTNLIRVKQFAGTSAGRFFLKGWLTRRQLDAADAFAEALHNYDRAMGMPSRTAKCLNMSDRRETVFVMLPSRGVHVEHR